MVRQARPDGHGEGWAELEVRREEITALVKAGVPVVKIGILLARQGVVVAERTLHRFAAERCGASGSKVTTPVDDGPPGSELQIDFGDLGLIPAGEGRRRKLRALVFTACFSRYMFVYLTFSMTLEEVIAGCEDAWEFFSGVFRVLVPDNMSPVVADADAVNPRLTREWLEYAQARGFVTDPARVRHPRDKPRVAYCTSLERLAARWRSCGWQLPGPDSRRQATTSLRTQRNTMALRHGHLPFCWAHEITSGRVARRNLPYGLADHKLLPHTYPLPFVARKEPWPAEV